MQRTILWIFAAGSAAFGGFALADPLGWYDSLPGASLTGPANTHFIRDIGITHVSHAVALVMAARVPAWRWPMVLVVAATTVMHAGLHVFDQLGGGHSNAGDMTQAVLVYGSTLMALGILWLVRPGHGTREA